MKAEQLAINSQCTFHWNLEKALDAYASAGFRCVEPHLNLLKDWLDDGHTVDEARALFESRGLRIVASSRACASAHRMRACPTWGPTSRTPALSASWEPTR